MALFGKQRAGGFMDVIRCDEPSYLIWKWHPEGSISGQNSRENAIRWGSSLRVKDGEIAVFVYDQKNGIMQDFIEGPFDQILQTENLPGLASIIGLAYQGGTLFQAEVYFINLAQIIQVRFGVPYFDVYDPRFTDFGVPVAVRGTISFSVTDAMRFVKLNRLQNFSLDDFQKQIRDSVCRYIKDAVANAPAIHSIPVIQLESKIAQINDTIEFDLKTRLNESFGVTVSGVDIGAIEIDKSSDGYHQLMSITRDVTAARVNAETTDYVERLRLQREEAQYLIRKQTQSANLGAFQVEKQAEVGVAGAEALGQTGISGNGGANLGSSSDSLNMGAVMASMAVGSAIGQNIAGAINNVLGDGHQVPQSVTPPPIPTVAYYIAINGQAKGPYDIPTLAQLSMNGQLNSDTLIWKKGTPNWEPAGSFSELKDIFESAMPPIPLTQEN